MSQQTIRIIASLALAILSFAIIEGIMPLFGQPAPPTQAMFPLIGLALRTSGYALPTIYFSVGLILIAAIPDEKLSKVTSTLLAIIKLALVVGLYFHLRQTLMTYAPFRGFWLFEMMLVLIPLVILLDIFGSILTRRFPRLSRAFFFTYILCGIFGAWFMNYTAYQGLYPSLHHTALLIGIAFIFRGSDRFCRIFNDSSVKIILIVAVLSAIFIGISMTYTTHHNYFYHSSALGRVVPRSMIPRANNYPDDDVISTERTKPDPQGVELFKKFVPLPEFEGALKFDDYNILLVISEATRFDKTSVFNEKLKTTPNLLKRSKSAIVATRNYSTSSGTLHAISSFLTMKFPSAVKMETWVPSWYGKLTTEEETITEVLGKEDYHTFWISHNHKKCFSQLILGFQQGFSDVDLVRTNLESKGTDTKIAGSAQKKLSELAESKSKFFGVVFFVSPHGPYLDHGFEQFGSNHNKQLYNQEIHNVDIQFEKIWQTLEETKLKDKTIVIFIGDHGEEFKEHGGRRHKTTVYSESIRVPLIVWIPGQKPAKITRPINTFTVMPWLFLSSENKNIRSYAEDACKNVIGPYLRATEGSAISELIGHDRNRTSLTYERWKINYDHSSRLYEIYDVLADPLEKNNLFESETVPRKKLLKLFANYKTVRAQSLNCKIVRRSSKKLAPHKK